MMWVVVGRWMGLWLMVVHSWLRCGVGIPALFAKCGGWGGWVGEGGEEHGFEGVEPGGGFGGGDVGGVGHDADE